MNVSVQANRSVPGVSVTVLHIRVLVRHAMTRLSFRSSPFFKPRSKDLLVGHCRNFLLISKGKEPRLHPMVLPVRLIGAVRDLTRRVGARRMLRDSQPIQVIRYRPFPRFRRVYERNVLSTFSPHPPFPTRQQFFFRGVVPVRVLPPFDDPFFMGRDLLWCPSMFFHCHVDSNRSVHLCRALRGAQISVCEKSVSFGYGLLDKERVPRLMTGVQRRSYPQGHAIPF